ncbi:MAG TPA: hypothetical protein VGJ21_17275 [Terracidiphilus sp.]
MPSDLTPAPLFQQQSATHTNPLSVGTSVVVNGGILALLLCISLGTRRLPLPPPGAGIHLSDFKLFAPSLGGGGGNHELTPASAGRMPQFSPTPIVPPTTHTIDHPLLAFTPALAAPLDLKLPDNPQLPNLGVHSSTSVILSDGPGGYTGIGGGIAAELAIKTAQAPAQAPLPASASTNPALAESPNRSPSSRPKRNSPMKPAAPSIRER